MARNHMSRPPYMHGAEQNWIQRETLTTDGSGSWGTATIAAMTGTAVQLRWLTLGTLPVPGTTLLILHGPGVGQSRLITAVGPVNDSVTLDRPLDGWAVPEHAGDHSTNTNTAAGGPVSLVAVVSSFGSKIFAGNRFNWTEVVQWYGNTLRGVMASNSFSDCNVQPGGNINHGSVGAVGECYHGVDEVWFSEFRQNVMTRSDGISIRDSYMSKTGENGACATYGGPWVRWSVIRSNTLSGISQASLNESEKTHSAPSCAAVSLFHSGPTAGNELTSDIVAEQNVFECPASGLQNSSGYHLDGCQACVTRL